MFYREMDGDNNNALCFLPKGLEQLSAALLWYRDFRGHLSGINYPSAGDEGEWRPDDHGD